MALIICPQCGKQISDKASKCPHCNLDLMVHFTQLQPKHASIPVQELQQGKVKKEIVKADKTKKKAITTKENAAKEKDKIRKQQEKEKPSKPGSGWLIAGCLLTLLGIILFISIDIYDSGIMIPIVSVITGIVLLIIGYLRHLGFDYDEITDILKSLEKK